MSVLGNSVTQQAFTPAVDVYSGNGSTVAFTLSRPVASVAQVEAFIENVPQSPVDAFTVNGNVITFTSAPPSGSSNIYVRYTSPITQVIAPSDGTVGLSSLSSPVLSAISSMGFKNRIINGAMMIDQRNAGASTTPSGSSGGTYTLDRWVYQASAASKFNVQQNLNSVTPPAGFSKYLGLSVASAVTVGSTDYFNIYQCIEGNNVADLSWGTASAATVTLSFWVRCSLTGTFGGALRNGSVNRTYPFNYTISAANTWEQKTITIAGDTSGTWATDNTQGIYIDWSLGVGSSYSGGTVNTWNAGNYQAPSSPQSVVGTAGATFYITGVQLEKGSTATSFDYRPYGDELALCQRYYIEAGIRNSGGSDIFTGTRWTTNQIATSFNTPATMRATPTATLSGSYYAYAGGGTYTISSIASVATVTNTGVAIVYTLSSDPSAQSYVILGGTSSTKTALSAEL